MSMETVIRKSLFYRTGVGGEGTYAATHVTGCSHGCRFPCYAFLMMQRFGKVASYEEWCRPRLVANALQLAQKELPHLRGKAHSIHLSFATDPFMFGQPEVVQLTLELMRLINSFDIPVHVLTKGVISEEALALSRRNVFGITLVSLDDGFRTRYEPGTAPYLERVMGLWRAHDRGLRTFVNMEPYPTPNIWQQDVVRILDAVDFADELRLGRLNYNDAVRQCPGWRAFYLATGETARQFCKHHHIAYEGIGAETETRHRRKEPDDADGLFGERPSYS